MPINTLIVVAAPVKELTLPSVAAGKVTDSLLSIAVTVSEPSTNTGMACSSIKVVVPPAKYSSALILVTLFPVIV